MVDFYIAAVRYTEDRSSISQVKIARIYITEKGTGMAGHEIVVPARFICELLRTGKLSIWTATKRRKPGSRVTMYDQGAEVQLFADKYLTTSPNGIHRDNLGELPEF
ncbi:hypothetical protein [Paracandidimonas soli]|uniref:hypothetical protein n=1 Tax=Paracandidimonas soli TaxID=1917182 RepID=UPI001A9F8A09|nr:hypothetical protein [Paracandidimonas soli]